MERKRLQEEVSKDLLEAALAKLLANGGDFAEIFCEQSERSLLHLEEGRVKAPSFTVAVGAGLRLVRGKTTRYGFVEELTEEALFRCADALAVGKAVGVCEAVEPLAALGAMPAPAEPLAAEGVLSALRAADEACRAVGPAVQNVTVVQNAWAQEMLVANSRGTFAGDVRNLRHMRVAATAVGNGQRRLCFRGADLVAEPQRATAEGVRDLARGAGQGAVLMLEAGPAPAGTMPVVIDAGHMGTGVVFHEACGHALETDHILEGASVFAGRIGDTVASKLVTLVDDATWPDRSRTYRVDDEGTPSQKTVLIEGGVLKGYLADIKGAAALGLAPTGSGRRQNFRHAPLARMSCTYLAPGEGSQEDILSEVKSGLFVKTVGGGGGDISGSGFVFTVMEANLIENGKVTRPVTGATLRGRGLELLESIDAVGNDLGISSVGGMCGKAGQMVPVDEGSPTVRVGRLTVGGAAL